MDSLLLEPICNSQEHVFVRKEGDDNCELCNKRFTDYKCKNCYRELCNNCHTDMILSIRDEQLRRTREILLEERDKIRGMEGNSNVQEDDIEVFLIIKKKIISYQNKIEYLEKMIKKLSHIIRKNDKVFTIESKPFSKNN